MREQKRDVMYYFDEKIQAPHFKCKCSYLLNKTLNLRAHCTDEFSKWNLSPILE